MKILAIPHVKRAIGVLDGAIRRVSDALVLLDWVYLAIFVHAVKKNMRRPETRANRRNS